ncbi:ATP-grasp domain-containing protein [Neobacillus sp. OS1-33]|uniref:ATP-grasp domain-containing protein n=1 Tax=Neobacillus sp. OS1-33 TaxID=3070683 RepID=UPI0027E1E9C8|nr:ATP-grasp domain-containing protein [Neobacillus sp. OS1-33]WML27354.1 ATP-grasp domain-containing protein [Neobacillus sp. OS1-33]
MSILILNRVPYSKCPYDKWLNLLNDDIILFTSEETYPDYKDKFNKVIPFKDYQKNGNVERIALELHKEYQFQTIIAISELDLLRAAQIREYLKLDGQSYNSALAFRNKMLMKKTIKKSDDVDIPKFQEINSTLDILKFIEQNGYPVVIKPICGSGSINTTVLKDSEELELFISNNTFIDLMIEEYIDGDMYHIDGLIVDNDVIFSWPSKYVNGCLAFQTGNYLGSYILDEKNPMNKRLKLVCQNVLSQFPLPSYTTFHLEVFHTKDDKIYFCEVASRTGGARVNEVLNYSFNLDITKLWIQSQCGLLDSKLIQQSYTINQYTGWLLIPPKKGELCNIPMGIPPEYIIDYKLNGKIGSSFSEATISVDHIASFLVKGETEQDLKSNLQKSAEWFDKHTKWLIK